MPGFISQGLEAVFGGGDLDRLRAKGGGGCKMGSGCAGGGEGCG